MKRSIKRLPKRTQEELTALLTLMQQHLKECEMIILFGSYARGDYVLWDSKIEFGVRTSYQSDYDILVIVAKNVAKQVERKLDKIADKYHDMFQHRRHASPQFIVEHINTVNRNLEVSQYFFTDIVKEGVMLYDSGKCRLAKPRELSFKEIRDIAQSEFDELYPYACGFLSLVKTSLSQEQNKIAAFLLHQTCEKLYNCILMVFINYRPKNHRIQDLSGMVKRFSIELAVVFPLNTDIEKLRFDLLCRSYIEARYNKEFRITHEELEYLISRTEILKEVTERLCKEKIAEYDAMIGQSKDCL